jgi:hypothetical protein
MPQGFFVAPAMPIRTRLFQEEAMRNSNESTRARIVFFGIIVIASLIVCAPPVPLDRAAWGQSTNATNIQYVYKAYVGDISTTTAKIKGIGLQNKTAVSARFKYLNGTGINRVYAAFGWGEYLHLFTDKKKEVVVLMNRTKTVSVAEAVFSTCNATSALIKGNAVYITCPGKVLYSINVTGKSPSAPVSSLAKTQMSLSVHNALFMAANITAAEYDMTTNTVYFAYNDTATPYDYTAGQKLRDRVDGRLVNHTLAVPVLFGLQKIDGMATIDSSVYLFSDQPYQSANTFDFIHANEVNCYWSNPVNDYPRYTGLPGDIVGVRGRIGEKYLEVYNHCNGDTLEYWLFTTNYQYDLDNPKLFSTDCGVRGFICTSRLWCGRGGEEKNCVSRPYCNNPCGYCGYEPIRPLTGHKELSSGMRTILCSANCDPITNFTQYRDCWRKYGCNPSGYSWSEYQQCGSLNHTITNYDFQCDPNNPHWSDNYLSAESTEYHNISNEMCAKSYCINQGHDGRDCLLSGNASMPCYVLNLTSACSNGTMYRTYDTYTCVNGKGVKSAPYTKKFYCDSSVQTLSVGQSLISSQNIAAQPTAMQALLDRVPEYLQVMSSSQVEKIVKMIIRDYGLEWPGELEVVTEVGEAKTPAAMDFNPFDNNAIKFSLTYFSGPFLKMLIQPIKGDGMTPQSKTLKALELYLSRADHGGATNKSQVEMFLEESFFRELYVAAMISHEVRHYYDAGGPVKAQRAYFAPWYYWFGKRAAESAAYAVGDDTILKGYARCPDFGDSTMDGRLKGMRTETMDGYFNDCYWITSRQAAIEEELADTSNSPAFVAKLRELWLE